MCPVKAVQADLNLLWVHMYIGMFSYVTANLSFRLAEGYSGSDLNALAKDAALGPIRGKLQL